MQLRGVLAACLGAMTLAAGCTDSPPADGSEVPGTDVPPTSAAPPTCDPYQQTTPVGGTDPFNIRVVTMGNADCFAADIAAAVSRWERVITTGFPSVEIPLPTGYCRSELGWPGRTTIVDDLEVVIGIGDVGDDPGLLGFAGACYETQSQPRRTLLGYMLLNEDVLDSLSPLRRTDLITHEIGHILGLGLRWGQRGLLEDRGTGDPRYIGTRAVEEWHDLGGTGSVPVEALGGEGTAEVHWRESTFVDELMTGWLNSGTNRMSRMTVAALEDLGYSVDYTGAEAYALPGAALRFGATLRADEPLHTEPAGPPLVVPNT